MKQKTNDNAQKIVLDSQDPEDCITAMKNFVVRTSEDWVDNDAFLVNVPQDEMRHLKEQLEPVFREAYVT